MDEALKNLAISTIIALLDELRHVDVAKLPTADGAREVHTMRKREALNALSRLRGGANG